MSDLTLWLTAQLDADAVTVRAVRPDPGLSPQEPIEFILAGQDITVPSTEAAERHIREFADPARVLREIDAKRQLLALHSPSEFGAWVGDDDDRMPACRTCGNLTARFPCRTLRLLASVYADRPGYQEAWRP